MGTLPATRHDHTLLPWCCQAEEKGGKADKRADFNDIIGALRREGRPFQKEETKTDMHPQGRQDRKKEAQKQGDQAARKQGFNTGKGLVLTGLESELRVYHASACGVQELDYNMPCRHPSAGWQASTITTVNIYAITILYCTCYVASYAVLDITLTGLYAILMKRAPTTPGALTALTQAGRGASVCLQLA